MMRVLLVDDHAVVREGLKRILAEVPEIVVAREAGTAAEALEATRSDTYDVVLLDVSLPDGNGFDILTHLKDAHPTLPVLIFSVHAERQYVARALQLGAAGYLTKRSAPQELVTALSHVVQGKRYISAALIEHVIDLLTEAHRAGHATLSEREDQVLRRLASGQTMKEIAYELSLSIKTVSTYRTRLLKKLGLRTTADLVRYALQQELVQ
jgi:two-component system invasion response regulator UvrY